MNNTKDIAEKIINCKTYDIPDIQKLASAYLELEKEKARLILHIDDIEKANDNCQTKIANLELEITELKEENEQLRGLADFDAFSRENFNNINAKQSSEIVKLKAEIEKLEDQNKELKACIDMLTPKARSVYLNMLSASIHQTNVEAGWWTNLATGEPLERNVGELLCLVHSEVSEALEAYRKDLNDDKLPHRKGFEVELVDALIRIFDIAGKFKLDLDGALEDKLEYNAKRSDHKLENRQGKNGKKF